VYIQITDHCNMSCAHCCYSCGPKKRAFMNKETFKNALKLAASYGEVISLGGGEPTTHESFWEFFGLALGNRDIEYVWMATNGKIKDIAIALAEIASCSQKFGVALSQDAFHEKIDKSVVNVFHNAGLEIRDVTNNVVASGRAKRTMVWSRYGCCCEDVLIDPKGAIWSCGCKKLSLGNVNSNNFEIFDRYIQGHDDLVYTANECLFTNTEGAAHNKRVVKYIKTGVDR